MSFSKVRLGLVGLLSADRGTCRAVRSSVGSQSVASTPSWPAFMRLVRERPVTSGVLDLGAVAGWGPEAALRELREAFPHLPVVLLASPPADPLLLFRLGKAGARELLFPRVDELERELPRALARCSTDGTTGTVVRALTPHVPRRELAAVQAALQGLHEQWDAETFADRVGLSRPYLSERLKAVGLPSAGHLLVWVRLLHAGRWLEEPGRTAESVGRQLEYANGAVFRRALRSYTGATPTRVAERGGLDFVLDRFLSACGYRRLQGPTVGVSGAA